MHSLRASFTSLVGLAAILFSFLLLALAATLGLGWLLALATELTYFQASLICGIVVGVYTLGSQRGGGLPLDQTVVLGLVVLPIVITVFALMAGLIVVVTSLSYLEASALTTLVGSFLFHQFLLLLVESAPDPLELAGAPLEGEAGFDDEEGQPVVIIPSYDIPFNKRGRRWVVRLPDLPEDEEAPPARRPTRRRRKK